MDNRYDIVVFGATGFTGKHMIEPAHKICLEKGLTVAVAGRSHQKLQATLEEIQKRTGVAVAKFPTIIADISDEQSLKEMTKKAKVLINCCGPFVLYGEPVVKACISTGTNYVDITGEPVFMDKMLLNYNDLAKSRGVYVVPACGLDCVPCDLGIVYLQDNFPGTLNSVELYIQMLREGDSSCGPQFNTGTWESMITHLGDFWEHRKLQQMTKPKGLPDFKPKLSVRLLPHTQPTLERPAILFPTGDKPCIERTQAYLYHHDKKRPVQVNLYFAVQSYVYLFLMIIASLFWGLLSQINFTKNLLIKYPKFFTFGFFDGSKQPSEEEIAKWEFCATLFGEGWRHRSADPSDQFTSKLDQRIVGRVRCKNPGYGATSTMAISCAKTVITERDKLPKVGGVYTPGAAFAKTSLIKQLNENGVNFELISIPTNVQ